MHSFLRFLVLLVIPTSTMAETWAIDTSHSDVSFSVTHMMVSTVTGTFGDFSGSVETDAEHKLTKVQGEVQIVSVNTRSEKRDKHLQGADFFDAASFPKATFESTGITPDGDGYSVAGTLTIRETTKDVVLKLTDIKGPIEDSWGNLRMGLVATTTINRQDFGVSWSKTMDNGGLAVSDEVELTLRVELKRKKAE